MATVELARLRQKQTTSLTSVQAIPQFLRDQSGDLVEMAHIHLTWHAHIEWAWDHGLHPLILAPFAHGKTIQLVVGRVCDFVGRAALPTRPGRPPVYGRNARIKVVCNDDSSARERLRTIGEVIESPEYSALFPLVKKSTRRPWNSDVLNFERDPGIRLPDSSITAKGVLSTGVGGRADAIFFDDIVDQRNAITEPALRAKVNDNHGIVWMSRLEPWGRVLAVGTRWHNLDLYGYLKENPGWVTLEQSIAPDFKAIRCKIYNAGPDYPDFSALLG